MQKPLVLVVEGASPLRGNIERVLSLNGFRTIAVADNWEGLMVAKMKGPDIIVTDVLMPDFEGVDFIRALKHSVDTRHIPVLLLTADVDVSESNKVSSHNADGLLARQFKTDELIASVKSLLKKVRQLKESVH